MPSKQSSAPSEDKSADNEVKTPRRCKLCGHTLAERNKSDICYRHHQNMSSPRGLNRPPFSSGSQGVRATAMDVQYHGKSEDY